MARDTFGGLAPGDYRLRVTDTANQWLPWSQDKVTVAAGDRLTVNITLQPRVAAPPPAQGGTRGTITGTVTGPGSGAPQAGVTVALTTPAGIDRIQTSGVDGTYTFGGLAPGDYRLRVNDTASQWAPWSRATRSRLPRAIA